MSSCIQRYNDRPEMVLLARVRGKLAKNDCVLLAELHAPSKESIRFEVSGLDWARREVLRM